MNANLSWSETVSIERLLSWLLCCLIAEAETRNNTVPNHTNELVTAMKHHQLHIVIKPSCVPILYILYLPGSAHDVTPGVSGVSHVGVLCLNSTCATVSKATERVL